MKNFKYERNTIDKINIKGILSADGTMITYVNDDKDEVEIPVAKCFEPFASQEITLSLSNKNVEDQSESLMEVE